MGEALRIDCHREHGRNWLSLLLCAVLLAACRFDASTAANRDGGNSLLPDADPSKPDAIAPEDCPEDIYIRLSVNGVSTEPPDGIPYVQILLGDTVALSAIGSCTRTGLIHYDWSIGPGTGQVEPTALPSLNSEFLTVYPTAAQDYIVTLAIGDGVNPIAKKTSVFGFAATGFEDLPLVPGDTIKDLHAGPNYLWIGARDGAYRADLSNPTNGPANGLYEDINDVYGGDSIPSDVRAVFEGPSGNYVWFGPNANDGLVYRLSLDPMDASVLALDTLGNARNKDISGDASSLRIATDKGVALSTDFDIFGLERADQSTAISVGATGAWAGKNQLYPLPAGTQINVFAGDNKIVALADDGVNLWAGSSDQGVARFQVGATPEIFTATNSELSSREIRAVAVDSLGDIWVATKVGVSRFKQDRQVWVPMIDLPSALGLDLKAIATDDSGGRRAIYAGSNGSLTVMRLPLP